MGYDGQFARIIGIFTKNDVKAKALPSLDEPEFFNFYKDLVDIHVLYRHIDAECLMPVLRCAAGKQGLQLQQHMA